MSDTQSYRDACVCIGEANDLAKELIIDKSGGDFHALEKIARGV